MNIHHQNLCDGSMEDANFELHIIVVVVLKHGILFRLLILRYCAIFKAAAPSAFHSMARSLIKSVYSVKIVYVHARDW